MPDLKDAAKALIADCSPMYASEMCGELCCIGCEGYERGPEYTFIHDADCSWQRLRAAVDNA